MDSGWSLPPGPDLSGDKGAGMTRRLFGHSILDWLAACLLFPALAAAQGGAREALSIFPADTQQVTYSYLAQLRDQPDYPQIHQRLLNRQLKNFEDFLRSIGTDPDRDVDEVTLGWRGGTAEGGFFGLATGRFQPDRVHDYFQQRQLPFRHQGGYELYAFGSGEDRADLYFTFLSSSSALFGRFNDLKMLLAVHDEGRPALDSNSEFMNWEDELEGTAPQWGISTGKAAANEAVPWLSGGEKLAVDPKPLLGSMKAFLYRVEWSNGFTVHLAILCPDRETANTLAQLVKLWKATRQASASKSAPAVANFLDGVDVQANGSRVEMTGSGPVAVVTEVFRGPGTGGN